MLATLRKSALWKSTYAACFEKTFHYPGINLANKKQLLVRSFSFVSPSTSSGSHIPSAPPSSPSLHHTTFRPSSPPPLDDDIGRKIFMQKTIYRSFGAISSTIGLSCIHELFLQQSSLYPLFMIGPVCLGAYGIVKLYWDKPAVVNKTIEVKVDERSPFRAATIPVISDEQQPSREMLFGLSILGTSVLSHALWSPTMSGLPLLSMGGGGGSLLIPLAVFGGAAYYASSTPLASWTALGVCRAGLLTGFIVTSLDILCVALMLPAPLQVILLPYYTIYQDMQCVGWSVALSGMTMYAHHQYRHHHHPNPDPIPPSLLLHALLYGGLSLTFLLYCLVPEDYYTREELDVLRHLFDKD